MKLKQALSIVLAVLMLATVALPVCADAGDNDAPFIEPTSEGLCFNAYGTYALEKAFSAIPRTVEAEILLPTSVTENAGAILSNEDKNGTDFYMTLDIVKGGVPRVIYKGEDRVRREFCFDEVDVRGEDLVKLTIVSDPAAGRMHCYLDGALCQTLTMTANELPFVDCHSESADKPFFVGGDATAKNPNYFHGAIRSLAVFSAPRTAADVLSDASSGVNFSDGTLLCAYVFGDSPEVNGFADLSSNQNGIVSTQEWFSAEGGGAYRGAYDYSFALVGDTQTLTHRGVKNNKGYSESLNHLYEWIVDNAVSKKMKYVIGLGDVTEKDTDEEWTFAKNAITKLDGVLPYTLVRGQGHDTVPMLNKYFAEHTPFTENLGGTFKEGSVATAWQELIVGQTKYLILSLDFGAPDEILAWASGVIEAHPEHRVIVTTHAYLDTDGTTRDKGEKHNASSYPLQTDADSVQTKNDGDSLWKKFVSKHESIFLVLSGHISAEGVVINQRKGDAGNTVTEMLIDPQTIDKEYAGGTGMVAMLYFSHDSDIVGVEYYSTAMDVYRPAKSFDINHTHAYVDTVVPPTCEEAGYTSHICECGRRLPDTDPVPAAHTYDDGYDAECNACGDVRDVETRPIESGTSEPDGTDAPIESGMQMPDGTDEPTQEMAPETDRAPVEDGGGSEVETTEPLEPTSQPESEFSEPTPTPDGEGDGEDGNDGNDGNDGISMITVIVVSTVGAVTVGGGGLALWFFVFKKKR